MTDDPVGLLLGEIDASIAVMRGEADELRCRDDVDDHLRDVAEGLELRADELQDALDQLYSEDPEVPE